MKKIVPSTVVLAMLLALFIASPALADTGTSAKPVAVVSLASYDELFANLEITGKLAGRPGLARGIEGMLADRSSAPVRRPHATPAARIEAIDALRRRRMSGPAIARQLVLPRSTVGAILRRLGLGRLAVLDVKAPAP